MKWLSSWLGRRGAGARKARPERSSARRRRALSPVESLESRALMAADTLPVLMVIADQHDFYYQEYGDTRQAIEAAGLDVRVAATTTLRSLPHPNTGEPAGTDGGVTPDIALANVNPSDYSAIAFVGGWGSSMYQYAFSDPNLDGVTDNYYAHGPYNGDDTPFDGQISPTKVVVNDLIGQFLADDKPVAGICHGVTVLAWARVDGVSPIAGKAVSVPWLGSPGALYDGQWYGYFQLTQYQQVVDNGATANTFSGQYGNTSTTADDVVVDGRIITAEDYDSALEFGRTIAREVLASSSALPTNQAPVAVDRVFTIAENSAIGSSVGFADASDPDAGQSLTYTIVGGNTGGAFAIDAATGEIHVANPAALDFETTPLFQLEVAATDDGLAPLSDSAIVTINLLDVLELAPGSVTRHGDDLIVQGTDSADWIYVWSGSSANQAYAWINGRSVGPFALPAGGRVIVYGGRGDDFIYATDARLPTTIRGEQGYDVISGGWADDLLDGGTEGDRIVGGVGNDVLFGGSGRDYLYGCQGADVIQGGDGDDYLEGGDGRDLLFGGLGIDHLVAGAGDDLLIGGTTSYDGDAAALRTLRDAWVAPTSVAERAGQLAGGVGGGARLVWNETVHDDGAYDAMCGGFDSDLMFAAASDAVWTDLGDTLVSRP